MDAWLSWMAARGLLPHGYCLQWDQGLVGLMVGSDAAIAGAYYSIPAALVVLYRRKPDLQFGWVFILFSLFIFSCGTTHVISLLNIWWPLYWLEGYAKATTAAVSIVTAVLLWPLIPRIARLPSTRELELVVRRLELEVAERRRAEAQLQALTEELESRVQERTRALEAEVAERLRLQDADRARAVAEQASRAKSEFLSRMSHELRTPLNAVLGFSELMQREDGSHTPREVAEMAGHIQRAGGHLLRLVDDLLDIGRIESGKAAWQAEPLDVAALAAECQSMVGSSGQAAGVEVRFHVIPKLEVVTDGRRLRQVLLNLLANAIKYNRPGGTVDVSIETPDSLHLHIDVRDSGIGMSAAQLAQLFQPFNRLGRERGSADGVGLGLVVVKNVIDLVGGSLYVESEEGTGTRFSITWPLAGARPAAQV